MFWVASTGVVNPADAHKIVCMGSIVQLGASIGGLESEAAVAPPAGGQAAAPFPQTSATLRYNVPPEGLQLSEVGAWELMLRYRNGNGRVLATLMEVDVPEGGPGQPDTVVERPLIGFNSSDPGFGGASPFFRTHRSGVPESPSTHTIDFGQHVYYISVTLSGPEVVVGVPPAVSSIQIVGITA
jgi:hypothetical protein